MKVQKYHVVALSLVTLMIKEVTIWVHTALPLAPLYTQKHKFEFNWILSFYLSSLSLLVSYLFRDYSAYLSIGMSTSSWPDYKGVVNCINTNKTTMGLHYTTVRLGFILVLLISVMVSSAIADSAKDIEECQPQLVGMATCLPYVNGEAKVPTPDCCTGLKQVLKNNKKCLCVIIRDRNDPNLGLQINLTRALGLPSTCNAPANVSQCPGTHSIVSC
jgi:hypothetical protein